MTECEVENCEQTAGYELVDKVSRLPLEVCRDCKDELGSRDRYRLSGPLGEQSRLDTDL